MNYYYTDIEIDYLLSIQHITNEVYMKVIEQVAEEIYNATGFAASESNAVSPPPC